MFPELRYANGDIQRKGFSRYTVKLINRNDEEAQVDNEHLVRDKKSFTKAMLRSFIKNTVSREPWNGAPWLVKEDFAIKYKIPRVVPPHLQRATTAAERKKALAHKKDNGLPVAAILSRSPAPPTLVDIKPASKSHKSKSLQAAMKVSKMLQDYTPVSSRDSPWSSPSGTPESALAKISLKSVKEDTPPPPPPPPKPIIIKYPIEDLDLPYDEGARRPVLHFLSALPIVAKAEVLPTELTNRRVSRASTRSSVVPSASPSPVSNGIDEEKVGLYLSTWVFLNIYCEPLLLDSFTFDDYLQALQFSNEDVDCDLFVEIHCALLKAIVNEQGVVQAQLPDPEDDDDEEEEEDDDDEEEDSEGDGEGSDAGSVRGTVRVNGDIMDTDGDGKGSSSRARSEDKEKQHRADELFEDSDSWIQRLKVRDFKNGGWQAIIVGLLRRLSADHRFSKDCEEILKHLTPVSEEPTPETVKRRYQTLDCNMRITVLHLLSRLTHETKCVRDYMEECAEEMTKHRKDKIEVQRARRDL
jgi:DDT domain